MQHPSWTSIFATLVFLKKMSFFLTTMSAASLGQSRNSYFCQMKGTSLIVAGSCFSLSSVPAPPCSLVSSWKPWILACACEHPSEVWHHLSLPFHTVAFSKQNSARFWKLACHFLRNPKPKTFVLRQHIARTSGTILGCFYGYRTGSKRPQFSQWVNIYVLS